MIPLLLRARALAPLWLVAGFTVWLSPQVAQASCVAPPPQVLWSYPAAGQSDVPTNATLWLRLSRVGNIALTLNGAPQPYVAVDVLSPEEPGRILQIEPASLAPNTDYVLRISYVEQGLEPIGDAGTLDGGAVGQEPGWWPEERPTPDDAGVPAPPGTVLEVAFRTGATLVESGAAASTQLESRRVDLIGIDERVAQHPCRPLIEAQGCFDTGFRKSLSLTVRADQALAFLVLGPGAEDTQLWPAECGPPLLYMRGEITDIFGIIGLSPQCYEVRALQPGGVLTESISFCTDASEPESADAGALPLDAGVDASVAATTDAGAADAPGSDANEPTTKRRDDGGCAAGSGDASDRRHAWSAGLLLGLTVLVRRAARRRRR